MAYVASLEERLREYEQNGVQANINLQKLAKRLDIENRKFRRAISEVFADIEIDQALDSDILTSEIKSRVTEGMPSPRSMTGTTTTVLPSRRSSSFPGSYADSYWTPSPFSVGTYPSAPLSDIRSEKLPITPPMKEDEENPARELLITLAPASATKCAEDLGHAGKRFCGLLKLLAIETKNPVEDKVTIPCRMGYELLKYLVDENDATAIENVAFELKDGVGISANDGSCDIDARYLATVIERLTDQQKRKGVWIDAVGNVIANQ